MVKGKYSKPRLRSTDAFESMSLPTNAAAFAHLSIQQQMQQEDHDVPYETPTLLGASAQQDENETSTPDSQRSTSIDLSASLDDTSARLRGKGLSLGLQTPVDPADRLRITPIGESTFFKRGVTATITRIIKNHFNGPWSTWRKVPNDIKELMFHKFQEKYVWPANQNGLVRRIWEKICADRLKDMLSEKRHKVMIEAKTNNIRDCKGMSREWITNGIWDSLIDTVWGTEEWQNKLRKVKENHLTPKEGGIPKHTAGSVPFVVHAKGMANEMKRDVSFLEVFNRTHKRSRGHGDFIDNKSKSTSKLYHSVLSQKYGEDSSSQPEFDLHAQTEAIGGMKNTHTHVYGFGTRVPATALLTGTHNNVSTSEFACRPINSNVNSPAIALQEKVKNLSENLGKILEELRGEIRKEIKTAMAKSMGQFMTRMETMFMRNAHSTQGDAGPSR